MIDGMGGMMVWMVLWGLVGLAVLVLAVLAIVWLVRNLTSAPRGGREGSDPAEQELRRRYAAGQIDREEYQQRLADLQAGQRGIPK